MKQWFWAPPGEGSWEGFREGCCYGFDSNEGFRRPLATPGVCARSMSARMELGSKMKLFTTQLVLVGRDIVCEVA